MGESKKGILYINGLKSSVVQFDEITHYDEVMKDWPGWDSIIKGWEQQWTLEIPEFTLSEETLKLITGRTDEFIWDERLKAIHIAMMADCGLTAIRSGIFTDYYLDSRLPRGYVKDLWIGQT